MIGVALFAYYILLERKSRSMSPAEGGAPKCVLRL